MGSESIAQLAFGLMSCSVENTAMLKEVNSFKDVAVISNHRLSRNSYVDYSVSKADQMLGLIQTTWKKGHANSLSCMLLTELIRWNLEYCSVAM